ncbi:hypothetical protein NDU88_005141 [Pleurodeles waltl]|uniref:Uncharacterized protein n=1 Tax=Pleurodeles waltl TaxID=8319 RepID=A0AAV7MC18_PLEWA|nr:hypothetical protein NDU88_005141 [Pleurodeles waltl]
MKIRDLHTCLNENPQIYRLGTIRRIMDEFMCSPAIFNVECFRHPGKGINAGWRIGTAKGNCELPSIVRSLRSSLGSSPLRAVEESRSWIQS